MRRKFVIGFAIYLAIYAGNLAVFATPVTVNLQFDGTYILVPVLIGNRNLMFILDTAAGGSVLAPAARDLIGFTDKDGELSDIVGAGGTVQHQSLKIPSISFGGQTQNNFNVTVIDLKKFQKKESGEPYAGILGNDFLRGFDVEINLTASKLFLYPLGGNNQTNIINLKKTSSVPNQAESEGFVAFNAFVMKKPVYAILDTGAPASILNWQAAKQVQVTANTKGVKRRQQGIGGLGVQRADTYLYFFKNIKVEKTHFNSGELRIADLSIFKALGLAEKPAMIFGLDMLKNHSVFISYSTKKIFFYKSTAN